MNQQTVAGHVQEVQRGTSNITYLKRATVILVLLPVLGRCPIPTAGGVYTIQT